MKTLKSPWTAVAGCLVVQLCVGIIYLWSVFSEPVVAAFRWTEEGSRMVSSYMILAFVQKVIANDMKSAMTRRRMGGEPTALARHRFLRPAPQPYKTKHPRYG